MIQLIVQSALSLLLHAHHISVCELEYKKDTKSIELVQQVFANDLELFIRQKSGNAKFDVRQKNEQTLSEIKAFFEEHLTLFSDTTSVNGTWIGYKLDGNNLLAFIEYKNISPGRITLENTIFLEMLTGQENIVHLTQMGTTQTGVCSSKSRKVSFDLM